MKFPKITIPHKPTLATWDPKDQPSPKPQAHVQVPDVSLGVLVPATAQLLKEMQHATQAFDDLTKVLGSQAYVPETKQSGRGRPPKGDAAMTNAERQAAYRARKKLGGV